MTLNLLKVNRESRAESGKLRAVIEGTAAELLVGIFNSFLCQMSPKSTVSYTYAPQNFSDPNSQEKKNAKKI
jgi:hypothetical protein